MGMSLVSCFFSETQCTLKNHRRILMYAQNTCETAAIMYLQKLDTRNSCMRLRFTCAVGTFNWICSDSLVAVRQTQFQPNKASVSRYQRSVVDDAIYTSSEIVEEGVNTEHVMLLTWNSILSPANFKAVHFDENKTSIRWKRSASHKVVRRHFSGVVNKQIIIYAKFL